MQAHLKALFHFIPRREKNADNLGAVPHLLIKKLQNVLDIKVSRDPVASIVGKETYPNKNSL